MKVTESSGNLDDFLDGCEDQGIKGIVVDLVSLANQLIDTFFSEVEHAPQVQMGVSVEPSPSVFLRLEHGETYLIELTLLPKKVWFVFLNPNPVLRVYLYQNSTITPLGSFNVTTLSTLTEAYNFIQTFKVG